MTPVPPELFARYNRPSPRYTCYPGVAHWEAPPTEAQWISHLDASLAAGSPHGLSLYVHIPFCQSLCTFCGCNVRIARNHALATPYVPRLLRELDLYRDRLGRASFTTGAVHLGGGTPTFLPAPELDRLLDGLMQRLTVSPDATLSVEADPRVTTREHLRVLRQHGFNRISIGVQDLDPRVLDIVNRPQDESQLYAAVDEARSLGFSTVSFDLIYGLPLQTSDSIQVTMDAVDKLRPDQVSFYPYAPVPWIKPSQRRFTEADLPDPDVRQQLLEQGRRRLGAAHYIEIGLDQYVQPGNALAMAVEGGTLHRNFMGYAPAPMTPLIGLGSSAMGDAGTAFAQNEKNLMRYEARVDRGELPVQRGHVLGNEDLRVRQVISDIVNLRTVRWLPQDPLADWYQAATPALAELRNDGLIELHDGLQVTDRGLPFLRNVCLAFDARTQRAAKSVRNDAA